MKNICVTALLVGHDGTLWIGTLTNGLLEFKNGKFSAHLLPAMHGSNSVSALVENDDGSLWIGTQTALLRFAKGQFSSFSTELNGPVLALQNIETNLWLGTDRRLFRHQNGTLAAIPIGSLDGKPARVIQQTREGQWIGSDDVLIHIQQGRISTFGRTEGLPGAVTALHADRHGTFWVGTVNGLCCVKEARLAPKLDESEKSFESIFCIEEDREGNVWVGTAEGLVQFRPKLFNAITREEGLSHGHVTSLIEDTSGNMWIATRGGGLNRVNAANGSISVFNPVNTELNDSLLSLRRGILIPGFWIGSEEAGLLRFFAGQTVNYTKALGVTNLSVHVVFEDSSGALWIGSQNGVYRYDKGSAQHFATADGLPGGTVSAIAEDHDRRVWIGTDGGLAFWKDNHLSTFTFGSGILTNPILSIHEDRESNLWLGTMGSLKRWKSGKLTTYTAKEGLFHDNILDIAEDRFGNLWMSSVAGVFKVKKKEFDNVDQGSARAVTSISFGKSDGMPTPQCTGLAKPGIWEGTDGRLWFATTRGIAVVDPSNLEKESSPPRIVIGEIIVDGQSVEPGLLDGVTPGRGEIEFHFAALSFEAPEKNRFKFKLEGVDPKWVDAGTRSVAYYNNIKPGRYTFRVQGCNSYGAWNEDGAKVAFVLKPHYWQTWWFKSSAILSCFVFIAAAVRYATRRKMQQKLERLEQQNAIEKERTRIAQDMHDELGSRLTEILMLSERPASISDSTNEKVRIASAARELSGTLDAIVWAVEPRNDSLDRVVAYLCDYAVQFLAASSIRRHFDIPMELPARMISAETRHHLFMVVKEILNNTVKYSGGTDVWFSLCVYDSRLLIVIKDNGKGFLRGEVSASGNGLINMEKRMTSIGATCKISSAPGQGTQVELNIPID